MIHHWNCQCANHSQILGDKAGTNREIEGKDKVVVTIGDVSQLKYEIMLIINSTYNLITIHLDCTFPISLADLAIGSSQLLNLMNSWT